MRFTESALEEAVVELILQQDISYFPGGKIARDPSEVLLKDDLRDFLSANYAADGITSSEINGIIRTLESRPASDLYESNKAIMKMISDGFPLKRDDRSKKDLFIHFIDYSDADKNFYKIVNQLEITGFHKRIPDAILYVNGIPLVVLEFKSAIREECTVYDAFIQLTVRYKRDIPELMKYNAFCVISDGANTKLGSLFAPYDFFYAWRKVEGEEALEKDGVDSLFTLIKGVFNRNRLRDIIRNFIFFPDTSSKNEKVVCRYPQYYAANKLFLSVLNHIRPEGDGKGGTYFGATGCGKSFTMLFLTRLLMRSIELSSPTIVLITDRTDLDDQLSGQFTNAKQYVGDAQVVSVESRADLREQIGGRESGGVFLTTIHKFSEDTDLLSDRNNIVVISDEAHRSQVNLDQKVKITADGVKRTFGFAKHLRASLPNATYVGFTGTPIDATLDVFGPVVDAYTMTESVADDITVRIVYEGRAAKVLLDNGKLQEIEHYYDQCADEGASDYAIEESKKASANMRAILGDPSRLKALAVDLVAHYERRLLEGATVKGKAIFVCSSRQIAYDFFKAVTAIRPEWAEKRVLCGEVESPVQGEKTAMPIERVKMVMTRDKDDPPQLYELLGDKKFRKELDRQFKDANSNFKIAIVVDMWLTGFDVPFLDTIYIDKPIQRHNLIQTISRVNRTYAGKEKGLVVDYIGIKRQLNLALAHYSKSDSQNIEEVGQSVIVVKDHLDLLGKLFHKFDSTPYFSGTSLQQLHCLNTAAEYVQLTQGIEKRFMALVKRLKAAYDICCANETLSQVERDKIHFYIAVRSILFKLTKGNAPDTAQMNSRVREMIKDALHSDGIEEVFSMAAEGQTEIDIFSDDYLSKIEKIKLPNTKIKLLQQLLSRAIEEFKKVNRLKGVDFSKKFQNIVDKYNERDEQDTLRSDVLDEFADEIIRLYNQLKFEINSFSGLGIDFEEKSFYDILSALAKKYDFSYPEDRLLLLSKEVKKVVDDKSKYTDWNNREDIKADLKVDLILLLAQYDYPPIDRDEVYKEIFDQAENFKKYQLVKANGGG